MFWKISVKYFRVFRVFMKHGYPIIRSHYKSLKNCGHIALLRNQSQHREDR